MPNESRRPSVQLGTAATKQAVGQTTNASVAQPADVLRYQLTRARQLCVMCGELLRAAEGDLMSSAEIAQLCRELEIRAAIAQAMADGCQPSWSQPTPAGAR